MGLFDYPGTGVIEPPARLSEITLLGDLSEADWARMLAVVETRQFKAGTVLIQAGDQDDSFYILTAGEVQVILQGDPVNGQEEKVLATIPEGSVFGEIAFFDGSPRSATIRARTAGAAVRVTREAFDNLSAWHPNIAKQLLFDLGAILAMRLRWTTGRAAR
jgi:CRP/FNR family cyclic AMP-dependent transcriptional regulator